LSPNTTIQKYDDLETAGTARVHLGISLFRGNDHIVDLRIDDAPLRRLVLTDAASVAGIVGAVVAKNPFEVIAHIESGLRCMDVLLDMLLKVRASLYVHLVGLTYTAHADNAHAYRLLKERGFREDTPVCFSRKLLSV
jgi:hypothetical protein